MPRNVPTYPRGYGLLKIFAHLKKIFKSSRIIGKRFKLVHIFNRSELIEVATFRSGENILNDGDLIKDH